MDNYLIHHGTKGQRWYHRRYQYEDGSLTPEGRIRYSKSKGKRSALKIAKERKKQKDREEKAVAKQAVEEFRNSKREKKPNYSPDYKKPVSEYTSEELDAVIKRLNLEAQYKSKLKEVTPQTVSRGQKVLKSLNNLNVGLNSAVGIYKNINAVVATTNLISKNLKTGGTEGAKDKKDKK